MTQTRLAHTQTLRAALVSLVIATAGCAEEGAQPSQVAQQFTVSQHSALLEASLVAGDDTLTVEASEVSPLHYEVRFDFEHARVTISVDYEHGTGHFALEGEPLDAVDGDLTEALATELARVIPDDEAVRSQLQTVLLRQVAYLQIVPVGEQLAAFDFQSQRGWVHLSCSCGNQHIGSGYYRTAGRGCGCTGGSNNGCKGRCGQGCGITSTPRCVGTTAYTQDCAKHDYGLGTFAAASDDYSFASNNCSCSGVGSCY